jgi:hypothetical protein
MMATKEQLAKLEAALKKAQADLAKAKASATKKPSAPTSGVIPGFTPSANMPTATKRPDEPGFVGPVASKSTASRTDSAASVGPLGGLGAGVVAGVTGAAASDTDTGTGAAESSTGTGGAGTSTDEVKKYTATDGTVFSDKATYDKYEAMLTDKTSISDTKLRAGQSAYSLLYATFSQYGLGSLVEPLEKYIQDGLSEDEFTLRLRETPAYQQRFGANKQRIGKGLAALSEAEYIKMEDQYQDVMRQYGLPASYYAKDSMGTQKGFEDLLANDVSNTELEDRLIVAQDRVLKSNPEVLKALKDFYPDIKDGDILAYTLDPKNAIKDIQRKVTASEIGGAAMTPKDASGKSMLTTSVSRAEELQKYGVDKAAATEGYSTIGAGLQRGSQLASIYGESPYTQATAESEVFKLTGAQEARKQRQKVTGLEKAAFGGQSGASGGALARDRAGGY